MTGKFKNKKKKTVHSHSKTKSECFLKILSLYGLRPPTYIEKKMLQTRKGFKMK